MFTRANSDETVQGNFINASIKEKFAGINVESQKGYFKKIDILLIIYFCLVKYSFRLDSFWTHKQFTVDLWAGCLAFEPGINNNKQIQIALDLWV